MRRLIVLAVVVALAAGCSKSSKDSGDGGKNVSGDGKNASGVKLSSYPATDEGARSVLLEFKPGADEKALLQQLRPTHADYETLFQPAFAQRSEAYQNSHWASGKVSMHVYRAQTDVVVFPVTSADIRAGKVREGTFGIPAGYIQLKDDLKAGFTFYCFYYVQPGEKRSAILGDGLVHVNGQWRIFPTMSAAH